MQFTLPLTTSESYNLDDFIISTSNQAVYDAITNWSCCWGVNPYPLTLLLHGTKQSGKTFLAKIWQNLTGAYVLNHNASKVHYDVIDKYKAFIIEDIECWAEDALLHYFNVLHEEKKYLLITTKILINNFILKDLSSRISATLRLTINPPDDELIRMFVFKHFANNSIAISDRVMHFLLQRIPRRFDKIIVILDKINKYALVHKSVRSRYHL